MIFTSRNTKWNRNIQLAILKDLKNNYWLFYHSLIPIFSALLLFLLYLNIQLKLVDGNVVISFVSKQINSSSYRIYQYFPGMLRASNLKIMGVKQQSFLTEGTFTTLCVFGLLSEVACIPVELIGTVKG